MTLTLPELLAQESFTKADIVRLLSLSAPADIELLRSRAHELVLKYCGNSVYFRGLIEFSNICVCDCYYCGIRKSNSAVDRYMLSKNDIVESARFCAESGYGSVVLQSGERSDEAFVAFIEDAVRSIKQETISPVLPEGLGITLCVGEQTEDVYRRLYNAGAHRYLLRIETTSPALFAKIHPPLQSQTNRLECLERLRRVGFQVGTGVMIGLPEQTLEDLANDILFFSRTSIDMIGMGPYIVHHQTPMAHYNDEIAAHKDAIFLLALKMIAVTRIVCKDVNIAATTALQAMEHDGREQGLNFGANIIMPQTTPVDVRTNYLLYEGKPCLDENASQCKSCLERRIRSVGREIGTNGWGDSQHFAART
jgi:biotin synthase